MREILPYDCRTGVNDEGDIVPIDDLNGQCDAQTSGWDELIYTEEAYELLMLDEAKDDRKNPEVAVRKWHDEVADRVDEYVDKRGCSPDDAARALYGCSLEQLYETGGEV